MKDEAEPAGRSGCPGPGISLWGNDATFYPDIVPLCVLGSRVLLRPLESHKYKYKYKIQLFILIV